MSDQPTVPAVPAEPTTEISYCPHQDLYVHKQPDGVVKVFNTEQLEYNVDLCQKGGDLKQAQFLAELTAWARKFPHKLAVFRPDGTFEVRPLKKRESACCRSSPAAEQDPEGGDQGAS